MCKTSMTLSVAVVDKHSYRNGPANSLMRYAGGTMTGNESCLNCSSTASFE